VEDPENGCSLGKAIMWFRTIDQRDSALEANGMVVDKAVIRVSRPTADSWESMKSGFFANIRNLGGDDELA